MHNVYTMMAASLWGSCLGTLVLRYSESGRHHAHYYVHTKHAVTLYLHIDAFNNTMYIHTNKKRCTSLVQNGLAVNFPGFLVPLPSLAGQESVAFSV